MSQIKVKWGVISTAKIGMVKVIPAMQQGNNLEIVGIASRNENDAKSAADTLGIPRYYQGYEALLDDPEIEAIYNPLPNHLHFEWTKKAIEKGKHVLCEKPMTLKKHEITELISLRDKHGFSAKRGSRTHLDPTRIWPTIHFLSLNQQKDYILCKISGCNLDNVSQ